MLWVWGNLAHPNPQFRLGVSRWDDEKQLAGIMDVMAKRLIDGCDVDDGCCEVLSAGVGAGKDNG